jgi:hypothetical protein
MANPDFEKLLETLYSFAQKLLAKNGEFYPFAASMDTNGNVVCNAGYTGEEHPQSSEVVELLKNALRAKSQRGEICAAGICFDVRVTLPNKAEKSDAICAKLEHKNDEAIEVFLPYHKSLFGKIKYGDVFASQGVREIF